MLDERTSAKISVLGSDYQKELLALAPKESLPSFLGGTCDCPGGCENADIGPWNDGSTPGYPQPFWESFDARDKGVPLAASTNGLGSSMSSFHTANDGL